MRRVNDDRHGNALPRSLFANYSSDVLDTGKHKASVRSYNKVLAAACAL